MKWVRENTLGTVNTLLMKCIFGDNWSEMCDHYWRIITASILTPLSISVEVVHTYLSLLVTSLQRPPREKDDCIAWNRGYFSYMIKSNLSFATCQIISLLLAMIVQLLPLCLLSIYVNLFLTISLLLFLPLSPCHFTSSCFYPEE